MPGSSIVGDISFYVGRIDKVFLHKSGAFQISSGIPSLTPTKPNAVDDSIELFEIKIFYLFESKRWDIVTKNNQTIKLPIKNSEISLQNFIDLKNQINFGKYKIFDYRINNQIILK